MKASRASKPRRVKKRPVLVPYYTSIAAAKIMARAAVLAKEHGLYLPYYFLVSLQRQEGYVIALLEQTESQIDARRKRK